MIFNQYRDMLKGKEDRALWNVARNTLGIPDNAKIQPLATTDWRIEIHGELHEFKRVWFQSRSMSVIYYQPDNIVFFRTQPVRGV